uniref:Bestrophin homolog n=1 Tax=Macrostomum lignano TaxID=282301 RepID=A0A1I8I6F4_9PLAT
MTVSYSETISSSQGGVFIKILLLWKGSLYKLLYTDLIVYLIMYYAFNIIYRACMGPEARQSFELVVKFCEEMDKSIPLSFILGFFVAGVIGRWWQMYLNIPWLNRISFFAYGILTGTKDSFETARRLRLSIMRYMNLGWILLMHSISEQIMHRFSGQEEEEQDMRSRLAYLFDRLRGMNQLSAELRSNSKKVQEERGVRGLLENINKCPEVKLHFRKLVTEAEIEAFVRAEGEYKNKYQKKYVPEYWLPLQWAALLCKKAMMHGFCDPRSMVMMMEEIEEVRGTMQTLVIYNDVMIPLVYTQVVIIAVYSFFLLQLFSQQFVNPKLTADLLSAERNVTVTPISIGNKDNHGEVIDMYFPVFTVFQFMFLMGWLKVAMCVMNPFGDDDEDFHTSEILNYNLEWIKKSPGFEADNLFEYLEAAEMEFSAVEPPDPTERLKPFTVEKTRWQALRDFLLCRGGDATSGGGGARGWQRAAASSEHNGGGGGDPQQSGASIPLTAKA